MSSGSASVSPVQSTVPAQPATAPAIITPGIGMIEVTEDTPILVLPLAERRRLFQRRRQMLHLREWIGIAGISFCGLIVASIALVSFLAH